MSLHYRKGDPDGLKILLAAALSGKKVDIGERNGESNSLVIHNTAYYQTAPQLVCNPIYLFFLMDFYSFFG